MGWFNYYCLIFIVLIMLPNIIYAIKNKDKENVYRNKCVEIIEQIGRYGAMTFMIFNIPHTYFNFWFNSALPVYLAVNGVLVLTYCLMWIYYYNKSGLSKALILSVLPSMLFIFSGIMLLNLPLMITAVLFAAAHIWLSCKNAKVI